MLLGMSDDVLSELIDILAERAQEAGRQQAAADLRSRIR